MNESLVQALVRSVNGAADEVLVEALRLGDGTEQAVALGALLERRTTRGLTGVVGLWPGLDEDLQGRVIADVRSFHTALRECGRSDSLSLRVTAMKLIAMGRQGKLAYVLLENLHHPDEGVAKVACEALVALARWVASQGRRLQRGPVVKAAEPAVVEAGEGGEVLAQERAALGVDGPAEAAGESGEVANEAAQDYHDLIDNRGEVEAAVARALDVHRGKHGPDLLRAACLLADWRGSKTLAVLSTPKHGGQAGLVRKLQQPPPSESTDAFLLGAGYGGLRGSFAVVFAHVAEKPVLDAMLRRTHWLADGSMQACLRMATRGVWLAEGDLEKDAGKRPVAELPLVAAWIAGSGLHDVVQDERLEQLSARAHNDFGARVRMLRLAAMRPRGTSVGFLRAMLGDSDERIVRMAAREIVRRRPPEYENILLQMMTSAPVSVRKVIGRAIGQSGFDQFWQRFDRLDRSTRRNAGRAMLKLLPDATSRLGRRITAGSLEQRLKAMQVAQELGVAHLFSEQIVALCGDANPRLRSKAVTMIPDLPTAPPEVVLDKALNDEDPRVRANAIEVIENRTEPKYVSLLTERARGSTNRERANAIKALNRMRVGSAGPHLLLMMRDARAEHRISAMWALRQIGWWDLLKEVGRVAKEDANMRVRRYALAVLKGVAGMSKRGEAS